MIKRVLGERLRGAASKFKVVSVTGPRQSGKTTLVRSVFPSLGYVSLEDLDTREFALKDPRGFLETYSGGKLIIDEIQRAPALFSYIQTIVDQKKTAGQFILTGSQNILLQENVSQTLAGRVAIVKLLPLSLEELKNTPYKLKTIENYIFTGFYPGIYDRKINPSEWYGNYIQTYIERDVRLVKNIGNLNTFQKFVKLCAGRNGRILNLSSLGNECGITHNTAKTWLSILEASYVVFLLGPYYRNFNKRIVKMPKMYFYDTGLVCALLGIQNKEQVATHYMKGNLFETLVLSEIIKNRLNRGREANCYYWRDKTGHEIDCILEMPGKILAFEMKSGRTFTDEFLDGLKYWNKLSGGDWKNSYLIYGGEQDQKRNPVKLVSWKNVSSILRKS